MDAKENKLKIQMMNFPEWYEYMMNHPLDKDMVVNLQLLK